MKEDAEEAVTQLKRQPGKDILLFGSANLAATLTLHGLIDEYRLGVNPIILGGGNPLFKPNPDRMKMNWFGRHTRQYY